jgi:hypothetical protein
MNRLSTVTLSLIILLTACTGGHQEQQEDELSAFGTYVYQLDTVKLTNNFALEAKRDTSRWAADQDVRQRYADCKVLEGTPLWFSRMGVSEDADSLLAFLRREAPLNGLDTLAFFVPQIAADLSIVHSLAFDSLGVDINEVLPRLDYCLSKAYVRYTVGQRYGFVRPDKLFNHLQMKSDGSGYARLFDYDIKAPDYQEAVKLMTTDDRMQYMMTSKPDSHVYLVLQNQLEKTADKDARHKLAVNMERCRWQIRQPGENERMILVNIPAQQLWAVCPDSVLNMRICCGATTTKTPLLNSYISYMQVNPEWIIPHNIVKTDVAHHGGDSAYFARHRYYIVDRNSGDTLNPVEVTSDQMLSGSVRVGQRGGAGNSLGRIVFRFPNNFSVYLHDTNNRGAFARERRTLSHGCVRVEKPFELACFLLPDADDWTKDKLRLSMDIRPETERGIIYKEEHAEDPRPLRLISYHDVSPRVPVYIIYYTAYPSPETGTVLTWPDLYGYDQIVSREMSPFLL